MKRIILSILVLLPFTLIGQGDTTSSTLSVLKDRIYLRCPSGSLNVPRPHDILSLPPAEDQETRITYDFGNQRLVFFAEEMNARATPHLLEDVRARYTPEERSNYTFRSIQTAGGLPGILTIPLQRDSTADAILIQSLLVQTKDSMLIQIGAYVNLNAYHRLSYFQSLAEKTLLSAVAGPRLPAIKARKEMLPVSGGICRLEIDCPENVLILPEKGFDYISYQIRKLHPLTQHVTGGIIVYTGLQPKPLASSYQFVEGSGKKVNRLLLGKNETWLYYADKARKIYLEESTYAAAACGEDIKIQVSLIASSEKELQLLLLIADKLMLSNH